MPSIEVSLADQIDSEINRLVEQGEFINRDQAVEELLSMGISAYSTTEESEPETEQLFTQSIEDQQDPAALDEGDDDYGF